MTERSAYVMYVSLVLPLVEMATENQIIVLEVGKR